MESVYKEPKSFDDLTRTAEKEEKVHLVCPIQDQVPADTLKQPVIYSKQASDDLNLRSKCCAVILSIYCQSQMLGEAGTSPPRSCNRSSGCMAA